MSDHWESFPCTMGERAAFISYDHGVRETLAHLPFPFLTCFRVKLDKPDDRGLPTDEEFKRLNAVEDELEAFIQPKDGLQVGRVTTDGHRHFYFYTALQETAVEALASRLGNVHGYNIAVRHESDAKREAYWNELFPSDDDWQVIQDIRVQDALQKEGDSLTKPREIQHWAYFKSDGDRKRFVEAVQSHFNGVDCYLSPKSKDAPFTAKLRHVGLPDYRSMNPKTVLLSRAAREANGHYDGWEALVCRE
jgi:hypothetical protein